MNCGDRSPAHDHLPDGAVGDGLLGLVPLVRGSGLGADLKDPLGLLHRIGQVLGLGDGVAHGLFQINVLALVHGLQSHPGVPVIGGGDDDGIDLGAVDDLVVVQVAVALVEFLVLVEAPLVDVADGDNLAGVLFLADPGELAPHVGAAPAAADQADIDAVVGADNPAGDSFVWTGSQGPASQAESRAYAGRALHEVSAIHRIFDF